MDDRYFYQYSKILERIFSAGFKYDYSFNAIEKCIADSGFFRLVETSHHGVAPLGNEQNLIDAFFPERKINANDVPIYNHCLWAADAYIWIQFKTRLSFEAIFLILPLEVMYDRFPIYHEMDFSHIVNYFLERQKEHTIFAILLERYGYKLNDVAEKTGISKDTLYSFKQGKRDIRKANVDIVQKLASYFHVRIETFASIAL